ncbi:hypothetical protein, partial [Escherichia coli]|uniref:hypothetical protein n=1 Tax=Escherichia coli TaxID=562 RepID=UPI001AD8AAF2
QGSLLHSWQFLSGDFTTQPRARKALARSVQTMPVFNTRLFSLSFFCINSFSFSAESWQIGVFFG